MKRWQFWSVLGSVCIAPHAPFWAATFWAIVYFAVALICVFKDKD
jgi:hypothetical protein